MDPIPRQTNYGELRTPATILVVEDERIVALELSARLTGMGHTVAGIAGSGEEAIDVAARLHPDLVLMDIKLQGAIDGIAAAATIRKNADTAIVYLTAFADDETVQRAKVAQPYGYILKPFHERELHVVIEHALYRRAAERSLREHELWRQRLLAIVTHDLRDRPSVEQLAASIRRNAERIARLIDDLLDVGRVDTSTGTST